MKDRIIEIIEELTEFNIKDDPDIDLFDNEILDSLSFLELISVLDDEFNIEIQPTQVDPNTWRKVDDIVELVKGLI